MASHDFPGSDHGPGTRWAELSRFWEKEGVRKGLGSPEWCGSGNESRRAGRARASLTPGQTSRVCHIPASQVEKGKDPELEEQFNALRREHTETLQGAYQDSRAPRSHPAPPPPLLVPLWLHVGSWGCCPPAPQHCGAQVGLAAPASRTGDAQFTSPMQSSREHMSRRSCCWQSLITGPRRPYRYPWRNTWGEGAHEGLEDRLLALPWCPELLSGHLGPWCAQGPCRLLQPWGYRGTVAQQCPCSGRNPRHLPSCFFPGCPRRRSRC